MCYNSNKLTYLLTSTLDQKQDDDLDYAWTVEARSSEIFSRSLRTWNFVMPELKSACCTGAKVWL